METAWYDHGWTTQRAVYRPSVTNTNGLEAPSTPTTVRSLIEDSNVLHVSVEDLSEVFNGVHPESSAIISSGANKTVNLLEAKTPFTSSPLTLETSDSPILSCSLVFRQYLLTSSMSGKLALHNLIEGKIVEERQDHLKYVVKVTCKEYSDIAGAWIATAAWDAKVYVYRASHNWGAAPQIGKPVAQIKLPSNPESILFVEHPEISSPVLLISRRDSTFLYYYTLPEDLSDGEDDGPRSLIFLGRQNLAPHSNAWIAFTPSAMALSPRDPSLLAVATSAVPHMKLIIVRLMYPPPTPMGAAQQPPEYLTQASQAQAELATQDREDAAILIHCTTLAPQTPYSTPALAWRPDGSGIYVNGDDGVVRGLETTTGKIKATLQNGHEAGSKIRCLWAGLAEEREIIVSGGFDRRLVVWEVEAPS